MSFLSFSVYEGVLSELNEAVFVHTDKLVWLNRLALELLGYEVPEEVLERCVLDFVAEDTRGDMTQIFSKIHENDRLGPYSIRLVRRDGSHLRCNARSSVLKDTDNKFTVSILRPIEVEATDDLLIAFLNTLRHEVNTLLAVLKGYTELTEDKLVDYFDPDVAKFLIVMKRNIARLENLTKKLMTLESIKDGLGGTAEKS